jgi:predicted phage terminase large subunit-like protein
MAILTHDQVRTEDARRYFREFLRQAWPIIEPGRPYQHNWHIDLICDTIQAATEGRLTLPDGRITRRILINIPPRCSKSTIVAVMWPAWRFIAEPHLRWMAASHSYDFAVRDNQKCRQIIQSEWYRKRWPHVRLKRDQNTKDKFETTENGFRMAASPKSATTGEGGDVLLFDDPHALMDAYSEAARNESIRFWTEAMPSRLNDQKTGLRLVIGQRVHENDLSQTCIKQGTYYHLCLPARFRSDHPYRHPQDPRTKEGEAIDKARLSEEVIADIAAEERPATMAAQYDQDPEPADGDVFKAEWMQYYTRLPDHFDRMLQSWDMAFKDSKANSFVAGHVWGQKGSSLYLVARVCEHLSFTRSVEAVKRMTQRYPQAHAKLIEDKANGPAIIDALKSSIGGIIAVSPRGSKEARAAAITPYWQAGNVELPAPLLDPDISTFTKALLKFPNGSTDEIDAMSQALDYMGAKANKLRTY